MKTKERELYDKLKVETNDETAKTIMELIEEVGTNGSGSLATKEDLHKATTSLHNETTALREDLYKVDTKLSLTISELRQEMLKMETRLLKWIIGLFFTGLGVGLSALVGILKYFDKI